MSGDLISRQEVLAEIDNWVMMDEYYHPEDTHEDIPVEEIRYRVKHVPQVPIEKADVIRCADCKWWDRIGDSPVGICHAMKHGWYTEHWNISIHRQYKGDFYCADAEPRKVNDYEAFE